MSRFRRRLMGLAALRQAKADEFVRVEYIENTSNAYIDTKIASTINDEVSITVSTNDFVSSFLCGVSSNSASMNNSFFIYGQVNEKVAFATNNGYTVSSVNIQDGDEHTVQHNKEGGFIDGQKVVSRPFTENPSNRSYYIFTINDRTTPTSISRFKLYKFTYSRNGSVIMDLVPVLNKGTNKYGMFDLVEQKFYTSPNGAKFVGGREIIYDAEIEYLESTGTQLIDTLYVPKGYDNTIETKITHLGYSTTTSWLPWFSTYVNEETNTYRIIRNNNLNTQVIVYNGNKAANGGKVIEVTVGTNYDFKIYPTYFLVNGTRYDFTILRGNANTNTLYLFGGKGTKIRMWGFKLTKGSTVVLDMIPVRVGNVGYMYDKVSGKLFGNDGSGNFILGKDVELYDELKTDVCEVHPKLIANTFINESTGNQQGYNGWSSCDYIDIEGFKYIYMQYPFPQNNYKYGAYYDKDKKRISNTSSFVIPSNAKYVRLSTNTSTFTNVWLFKRQFTTSNVYQNNHYIETDGSIIAYNNWKIFNTESEYNYYYCWIYAQSYRYQASYNADGSVYQSGKGFLEKPKYGKVLLSDSNTSITYYAGYNYEYKNMNE